MRVEPGDDPRPSSDPPPPGAQGSAADEPPTWVGPDDAPPRKPYWEDERHPAAPAPPPDHAAVRSPRPRLRGARASVWVTTVLALLHTFVCLWGFDEVRRAIRTEDAGSAAPLDGLQGEDTAVDALNLVIGLELVATLVGGVALVVSAVLVIRWQNVAVGNQRALGVHPRYSPAAAGWSWFVPFWALFGPKRALNDAWRAAEPNGASTIGRDHWTARHVPGVFAAWWASWLVSTVLQGPIGWSESVTLGDQRTAFVVVGVGSLVLFVSGPLFVTVLERITDRHDDRRAEATVAA
jgi:hypothetical protein